MARQTWDELRTAFADNVSGDITAGDMRDFVDSVSAHVSSGAPGATDDASAGFDVGAVWVDVSDPSVPMVFVCVSNVVGAAVWSASGGGGGSGVPAVGFTAMRALEESEYVALDPPNANTLYFVLEAP